MHENDQAASFYIIKSGKVVCKKGQQEMRVLVEGESFGESGLLEGNQIRLMSVVAKEPTIVLSLGKDMLKKLLGDQVELIIYKNIAKWALEKCDGIKELPQSYRDMINSIIELKHLNKGDVYLMKNKPAKENIVIILQGQLNYESTNEVAGTKFSVFGMKAFYEQGLDLYSDNIVSQEEGVLGLIKSEKIVQLLQGELKDAVKRLKFQE